MARGRSTQRDLIAPLLATNLIVHLIVVGLAAWSLDKYINGEQDHPHLGGNPSTSFMVVFALMGAVIGVMSVGVGAVHYRSWNTHSLASASSTALISWAITALSFGLVCKQIILGGRRGKRLKTLEAFITISLLSQLLYLLLLHAGILNHRYGPGFRTRNTDPSIAMPNRDPNIDTPQQTQ